MSDRANRVVGTTVALILLVGGGLGLSVATGVFGRSSAQAHVVTSTLARHWRMGGAASFAVVAFVGLMMTVGGLWLARRQLARNEGRSRLEDFVVHPPTTGDGSPHGVISVRAACLSHGLEADIERIPGVERALIGLFEPSEAPEVRARLDVIDGVDLNALAESVGASLNRLERTASVHVEDLDITVGFVKGALPRVS
ncbi:MAG TPA: hypothetical protein VH112_00250 [Acidimicrobiales bacterium]|nr:hypothetical protein [Acidimicrobiales bacterium]